MTAVLKRPFGSKGIVEASVPAAVDSGPAAPAPRVIKVYANLLPDEVIANRRLAALKRRLVAGMALLVLLLAAGYGYSWWQTSQAEDNLALEQTQSVVATSQLNQYAPLVQAQASAAALQAQVASAMASDLQWSVLMAKVRACAPVGLAVTQISGSVTAAAAGTASPLTPAGEVVVGQLSLSGTAQRYSDVATFVDALAKVKGLSIVSPGSISNVGRSLAFTVSLSLTTDALGGRFAVTPAATAGQTPSTSGS